MTDFTTFTEAADKMKQFVPQVTFNKNGYEIRAQVLEMAQQQLWNDYHAKFGAFSTTVSKEGDHVVTKVEMPAVPGVDQVIQAAEKFYAFVNQNTKK
jgi:hypothetical protein